MSATPHAKPVESMSCALCQQQSITVCCQGHVELLQVHKQPEEQSLQQWLDGLMAEHLQRAVSEDTASHAEILCVSQLAVAKTLSLPGNSTTKAYKSLV